MCSYIDCWRICICFLKSSGFKYSSEEKKTPSQLWKRVCVCVWALSCCIYHERIVSKVKKWNKKHQIILASWHMSVFVCHSDIRIERLIFLIFHPIVFLLFLFLTLSIALSFSGDFPSRPGSARCQFRPPVRCFNGNYRTDKSSQCLHFIFFPLSKGANIT